MVESKQILELRPERWLVCSPVVYDAIATSWAPCTSEASLLRLRLRDGLVELIESPQELCARIGELDEHTPCVIRVVVERMDESTVELLHALPEGDADLRLHVWREAPLEVLDALNTPDDAVLEFWRQAGHLPTLRHVDPQLPDNWGERYVEALRQWESDACADHGEEAFAAIYGQPGLSVAAAAARNVVAFAPPVPRRNNLPVQSTSFIGRIEERREVRRLLHTSRLVTLTGTGGAGKTRLALQVGAEVIDEFPDGVWFVEPTPFAHERLVPQTVASALGIKEQRGMTITETVIKETKDKKLLLLLDNCEHLLHESASLCEALLNACPGVHVMASSRQTLNIEGEAAYRVPSLPTPDARGITPVAWVTDYPAVELFVDRARAAQPSLAIDEANAEAIGSICRLLDGIPLAIELAAAAVRLLPVKEIHGQLKERFEVLMRVSRSHMRRGETLRSLIDWSYAQLDDAEQALLRRLAVFAGDWSETAARAICFEDNVKTERVVDLLRSLVEKSLIRAEEHDGVTRYRLLETVRQYARRRLDEGAEEAHWRGRHLAYFVGMAEEAEPHRGGTDQQSWLDRLAIEHDNLRSALIWAAEGGRNAVEGLRLAGALGWFWNVRGFFGEGRYWLSKLLAATPHEQVGAARSIALYGEGMLAWRQGDYSSARGFLEEALSIFEALGDRPRLAGALDLLGTLAFEQGQILAARKFYGDGLAVFRELAERRGIAVVLGNLGAVTLTQGDYPAAEVFVQESLTIFRELDDKRAIANALNNLGVVAFEQGSYPAARALYDESLAIFRELRDRWGIPALLTNLGDAASAQGNHPAALALLTESLQMQREVGDQLGIAASLSSLGNEAYHRGDYAAARELYEESLVIRRRLQDQRGVASSLEGLADVAVALGKPRRAACLWGAADRLREEIASPMPLYARAHHDSQVAATRAALADEADFDRVWQEGRAMPLERVVEYALEK